MFVLSNPRNFDGFETKPRWVIVEDIPRDVSDFAHLPPKKRPDTFCPLCQEPVTLELGAIKVHHYAHQVDNDCLANLPETALHLNVKFYLADQLNKGLPLVIAQPCGGGYQCSNVHLINWLEGWDEVQVEYTIHSYRPDIALLRYGRVLGAIEVLVSHPVSPQKEAYYAQNKIAWIEVAAKESLYQEETKWIAGKPLSFVRLRPESSRWVCYECERRQEEDQRREQELERRRLYKSRNYTYIHAAKMVDLYFPSGSKYREVFYAKLEVRDGVKCRAWVEREGFKRVGAEVRANPLTKEDLNKLSEAWS